MLAALGAYHCRSIVEEVGGTGVEAGVVANCHEESGVAFEASCCFVVPAVYAGHMTAGAVHGHIIVVVVFIAQTFLAFEFPLGVCIAVEAVVLLVSVADCAGVVAGGAVFVLTQTVVTV